MVNILPKGFDDLEGYATEYALNTPLARQSKRAALDMAALKAFYDGVFPHLDRIFSYLKSVPMDRLTEADRNLYNLGATWMELSHPVDLGWKDTDERHVFSFERVYLTENSPAKA
jgi:hypothetical protein